MLRITFSPGGDDRAALRLEGSLIREWAALLERECFTHLGNGREPSLDLSSVTFVDQRGLRALARLARAGIEIRCPSGSVADVLEGEGIPFTREPGQANFNDRKGESS